MDKLTQCVQGVITRSAIGNNGPTTLGDFIFPLKPSFKLGFKPNFGLKPN